MTQWRSAVLRFICIGCGGLAFALSAGAADGADPVTPPVDPDITVQIAKVDEDIVMDASFVVAATQKEVWDVLVDYEHMPEFLENLQENRIIQKSGNRITLFQRGTAVLGPFFTTVESTRQVDLVPMREIRSRVIAGDVKKSDGLVLLEPRSTETRVIYHNETIPHINLPFVFTKSSIEAQIRRQLELMRNEILRRKLLARKAD